MSEQDNASHGDTRAVRAARKLDRVLGKTLGTARQIYDSASMTGSELVSGSRKAATDKFDQVKSKLGEDYQGIFLTNPLVTDSLSRIPLTIENKDLLSTVLNVPWTTTLLWTAATGAMTMLQRPVSRSLGGLFHYGPGHVRRWAEINQFMDSVPGSGHRLKFGHSVDFLPEIIERFGIEGVPAFFCHLIQDSTTVDGIPLLPNTWALKQNLAITGLSAKTATALVSLSASNVLAAVMVATTVYKIWRKTERDKTKRKLLSAAESAAQNLDFTGAIESYKRALEIERSPSTLMAIGQVYLNRKMTRPYAHSAFAEAMKTLSADHTKTIPYYGAQLSLRGIAGLQALGTADAIADKYPQYWQDQVEDLVNGTIHSFASTAAKLEQNCERWTATTLMRPALFSSAINRYLAAQTACQYPLIDKRQEVVGTHITAALSLLGRMAQQDEDRLRNSVEQLRTVWARTILPSNDATVLLATS